MKDLILNIEHCPTMETIEYHNLKANDVFPFFMERIEKFMTSGEESMCFFEDEFENTWVFSLVMGLCGKRYFRTNTAITYGRGDGNNVKASIGVINKVVKYDRLIDELNKIDTKMENMVNTSSKYEKMVEKREKICRELEKYKPF